MGAFSRPGTMSMVPLPWLAYHPASSHCRYRTWSVWKFWSTGTAIPFGYCGLIRTVPDDTGRPCRSSSSTVTSSCGCWTMGLGSATLANSRA